MGAKRIVIKIGTSSIVNAETGFLHLRGLADLVDTICTLRRQGTDVILVSSGAVGVGIYRLHMNHKPKLAQKQAAAAVGQGHLMQIYDNLFSQLGQTVAQVLISRNDIAERGHYLNAKNTFKELLAMGVVPIVNENDTVNSSEIRFGDNDSLSELLAGMVNADWLFLLTDVDALYTSNPKVDPDAKPIHVVHDISKIIDTVCVDGAGSDLGTGGMITKLQAASFSVNSGVNMGITLGSEPGNVLRMLDGEPIGTIFVAKEKPLRGRKWWIVHAYVAGSVYVDAGATRAIRNRSNLFAVGIERTEGNFSSRSCIEIRSAETGKVIGRGITTYSSAEIDRIKGFRSNKIASILGYMDEDYIIHRNNLVLIADKQSKIKKSTHVVSEDLSVFIQ